jgi:hypothetical protein
MKDKLRDKLGELGEIEGNSSIMMKKGPSIDRWDIIWLKERIPSERSRKK